MTVAEQSVWSYPKRIYVTQSVFFFASHVAVSLFYCSHTHVAAMAQDGWLFLNSVPLSQVGAAIRSPFGFSCIVGCLRQSPFTCSQADTLRSVLRYFSAWSNKAVLEMLFAHQQSRGDHLYMHLEIRLLGVNQHKDTCSAHQSILVV